MKILFRLLAWSGVYIVVMGIPRDLELVTQILPATAARPRLFARAMGELSASLVFLVMTIGFFRMSMRKRADLATGAAIPGGARRRCRPAPDDLG